MNKKLNLLIILVCLLGLGSVFVGCDNGTPGNTDPKTIIITGINFTGEGGIDIPIPNSDDYAWANGNISNNSITFSLKNENDDDWTGSGHCFIFLEFYDTGRLDDAYIYTDGKSLSNLGLSSSSTEDQLLAKIPKYNIINAISTIDFSKFVRAPEWLW
jgi:hypothetical protein